MKTTAAAKSTRFAIVKHALHDVLERLGEMPVNARVRALRAKALSYERAVNAWSVHPPSEEQRAAMLKCVIDLNVEVIQIGRESAQADDLPARAKP
jgi:hypothetical protein